MAYDIEDYNEEEWKENIEKLCYRGIKAKFTQHDCLRKLLLETGQKCIVECAPDMIWGTGVSLNDKDTLNKSKWNKEGEIGLMGTMLMKIRDEFRSGDGGEAFDDEYGADTDVEETEESMTIEKSEP